ncbi:hypothetical protein C8F01DRAFT_1079750 [Mycena amicta]|nr:hypothetical protein C8F01DRAFT_1079750 [Mycena amicta]
MALPEQLFDMGFDVPASVGFPARALFSTPSSSSAAFLALDPVRRLPFLVLESQPSDDFMYGVQEISPAAVRSYSAILQFFVRRWIFLIQVALDPDFILPDQLPCLNATNFEALALTFAMVFSRLDYLLKVVRDQSPDIPAHSVFRIPSMACNMFRILRHFVYRLPDDTFPPNKPKTFASGLISDFHNRGMMESLISVEPGTVEYPQFARYRIETVEGQSMMDGPELDFFHLLDLPEEEAVDEATMPPSPFVRNSAGAASSRLDQSGILDRFIDVLPPTLGALVRQMPPIERLPVLIETFSAPDSLLDSLGNSVGASDAYTRLFTLFIQIWVYFVQQAVDPEFVLPIEFAPPTPDSESGLRRGLGLLILSLRDLTPPCFIPAESRNTFRILLHILRHTYQPVFHGESPNYAITLVQDFLARAEADAIARPNAAREACVPSRLIFFMAGVVPLRSYLGDDLILKIAELLPGPDSIAPPLVPGAFSLDVLFAFSLRPAVHSLHAFVISSFFRPFSFRPVSEAELARIRQAVRALADVFWAVFVGRSSLCMVHGGRVNPNRWPDVVIPAQAASMLRIFESILDHFGYYLPDGTESPEMTAQHVDIGSVDSLEEYLHRPGVVLYCREVLIPLRNIILVLDQHVTLSGAPMASPSWVRHRTAMFILLLSHVQDYVEPLRGAAPGSRVPTPSYAALDFIGKVILRYGLEGDHVPGVRLAADATLRSVIGHVSDVAWGMSARHAEISRTRAGRSPLKAVSLDPEIAGVHALIRRRFYSRNLKSFFVMDSSLVEYRPVDALAAPSEQLMRIITERARVNPLASSYVNSPDGLGRFFQDFYRPLATALNNAFPGSAAFPTDVPVATREAMIPFVGKLFEWSIIAYQICTQITAYSQTPLSAPQSTPT